FGTWLLIHEAFDLHFLAADAVGLVPVQLGLTDGAIGETDLGNPFALSPATSPIHPAQPRQLTDRRADGEGLDVRDPPDDLKVHSSIFGRMRSSVNPAMPIFVSGRCP